MTGGGEVFTFLTYRWDVTLAWQIAEGREPVTADVSPWWTFLGPPPGQAPNAIGLICVDDGHAATADLSRPLLFVTHPDIGQVLIDGWHRLRKAQIAGTHQPRPGRRRSSLASPVFALPTAPLTAGAWSAASGPAWSSPARVPPRTLGAG